jgi:hypothetical protein
MSLTSELMDEAVEACEDEPCVPDAPCGPDGGVIVVGVILIDHGDLRVDPVHLF